MGCRRGQGRGKSALLSSEKRGGWPEPPGFFRGPPLSKDPTLLAGLQREPRVRRAGATLSPQTSGTRARGDFTGHASLQGLPPRSPRCLALWPLTPSWVPAPHPCTFARGCHAHPHPTAPPAPRPELATPALHAPPEERVLPARRVMLAPTFGPGKRFPARSVPARRPRITQARVQVCLLERPALPARPVPSTLLCIFLSPRHS